MSDSSNTPINPQDMAADLAKNVDKAARKVVSLTDKGPIKGFKKFISRGSMIDMAVGVVMGSAVTTVVNSIVNHLISPLIGMIGGVPDMSGVLTITFNGATISFGAILNAIINFLLIGVAVYLCIVLPINKLRDMGANEEAKNTEPTTEEQTLAVLQEIRDELEGSYDTSIYSEVGYDSSADLQSEMVVIVILSLIHI